MKFTLAVFLTTAIAAPAFAHDPSLHKTGDAKDPECAKMDSMDTSKMDPNDPVMKAIHAKCAAAMKHEHDEHADHDHPSKDSKVPKAKTTSSNPHSDMNHPL